MTTATKHLPVVRLACMRNGIPFFVVADPFAPLTAEWERRFEACGELNRSILATRQPAAVRARRAKLQYQLAEFRDFANHFQLDPVPV